MFSGPFYKALVGDQNYSKMIFTVLPDTFDKKHVINEVRSILEQSKKGVIGFMFTMPVSGIYPIKICSPSHNFKIKNIKKAQNAPPKIRNPVRQ